MNRRQYGIFVATGEKAQRLYPETTFEADEKNRLFEFAPSSDEDARNQAQSTANGVNVRARLAPPCGPKAHVRRVDER